jgi:hypothetical protein
MTTAAEIKQAITLYPADAQRLVFASSQLLTSDEGRDHLARDVVGLANRDGGRVVLGVDAAGRYEESLALDDASARSALDEMLTACTAPRVDAQLEHLVGEDGELLVVAVPRRTGAPHAVARTNAKGSVGARLYCVRHRDRTVPVSDAQLRWLFGGHDMGSTREFEFTLHLQADGSGLRTDVIQPRVADGIEATLAALDADHAARLFGDPQALQQAAVELSGWVFLEELADHLDEGAGVATAEQQLEDLPVPGGGSVFADVPGGLRGLLGGGTPGGVMSRLLRRRPNRSFLLPEGAEIQVDYLARLGKARVGIHGPELRIGFSALAGGRGEGIRWPGLEVPESGGSWVSVKCELQVELPFPADTAADGGAAEAVARALRSRLAARWDDATLHAAISPATVERLVTGGS